MQMFQMIPFLMSIRINTSIFEKFPEYSYNLKKTIVVLREPLQTTQYTATVRCQIEGESSDMLLCLLHDVDIVSTLTYQNLNTTNEITHEQLRNDWFKIKFDSYGIKNIFVNKVTDKKDLIKQIAYQFHIGGYDIVPELNDTIITSQIESSVFGTCMATFTINLTIQDNKDKEILRYYVISNMLSYYNISEHYKDYEKNVYIYIEKKRQNCRYSLPFADFLNGMEAKYIHTMEIFKNKLNIFTTMEGQLPPDPWNPLGTPVFRETMQLSLINVLPSFEAMFDFYFGSKDYIWTELL